MMKSVLRPWLRRRALQQVGRVRRAGLPAAERIATAIDAALVEDLSPDEQIWVSRIESLRSKLARDDTLLTAAAKDAPSSTQGRTLEQLDPEAGKSCTVAQACRASKSRFWTLLLFKLVRALEPETIIELGTCLGVSAAYQAAALELNGHGKLLTLEGFASRAAVSRRNLKSLGLENAAVIAGVFDDTLEQTLAANAPIDYAFIDGHHDEHATIKYYEQFLPHLVEESVVVFDDIAWSDGMRRAWRVLQQHRNVALSIDLHNVGICVVRRSGSAEKHSVTMRMPT